MQRCRQMNYCWQDGLNLAVPSEVGQGGAHVTSSVDQCRYVRVCLMETIMVHEELSQLAAQIHPIGPEVPILLPPFCRRGPRFPQTLECVVRHHDNWCLAPRSVSHEPVHIGRKENGVSIRVHDFCNILGGLGGVGGHVHFVMGSAETRFPCLPCALASCSERQRHRRAATNPEDSEWQPCPPDATDAWW